MIPQEKKSEAGVNENDPQQKKSRKLFTGSKKSFRSIKSATGGKKVDSENSMKKTGNKDSTKTQPKSINGDTFTTGGGQAN